jgi:hypothetical protein
MFRGCRQRSRVMDDTASLGGAPEVPVNSKDSTAFWGRFQNTLFPSNLDRREGTCLESAVDLLGIIAWGELRASWLIVGKGTHEGRERVRTGGMNLQHSAQMS